MDLELSSRRAVITGGSRGIGLAVARVLAAEGANLALAARWTGSVVGSVRNVAVVAMTKNLAPDTLAGLAAARGDGTTVQRGTIHY